jgi:ribokinase
VILSVGSVNADFQVRIEEPLPEKAGTVLAGDLLRASGGKAANVSVLARRLGAEARLLGCVGDDDLAEQALAGPRRSGVDVALVRRVPGPTGLSTILVHPDGDKVIVLALNANDRWSDDAAGVGEHVGDLPPGSVLVVDLEVPVPVVEAAVQAARRRGITVVLDPAPAERLSDELLAGVDHVTPDHREAGELTGIDASSPEGACRAGRALRDRGAETAYVKLSSGGCAVVSADGQQVVEAPSDVEVADTTGAGDAFAGALAWAVMEGRPPVDAATTAVAAASCAVRKYGSQASYPSADELDEMAARVVAAGDGR